jgi:hypothetical protein
VATKNFWTSKEGKKATQQAAATDAAGAMRVSPGSRPRPEPFGIGAALSRTPVRGPLAGTQPNLTMGKVISSSGTGYGGFRGGPDPLEPNRITFARRDVLP